LVISSKVYIFADLLKQGSAFFVDKRSESVVFTGLCGQN